jgi:hypothetical protein
MSNYKYEKTISSYWNLADKASTIDQKIIYMDKFVKALESAGLTGKYNAVWLETSDNSFDKNLEAVKSLQSRLHEIKSLDPKTFEYNTAINQITAQEQGEAKEMLSVFEGVWNKENYTLIWNWIGACQIIFFIVLLIIGIVYCRDWSNFI